MENIDVNVLLERIEKLENEAARGDDYREICNVMAAHCYCYNSHEQAFEIENFWTKEKQDTYYNGNTTPEGVAYYYINNTAALREKQREIVNRVYGLELTDEDKVGYRVVNMLGTPYIQIAKDRQTAQGIWQTFNVLCHVDSEGVPQPSVSVGKICAEFCRENGRWKLWRFRGCPGGFDLDVKLANDGLDKEQDEADKVKMDFGLPKFTDEELKILHKRPITKVYELNEMGYQPWNPAVVDPPLPMPYDTWDDSQSFFQFLDK